MLVGTAKKNVSQEYTLRISQSMVVLCIIGMDEVWPIKPVHSKIQIYTFTFSDTPLLTLQDDS